MKYCSICGKPMGWQGTITLATTAGTRTVNGVFGLTPDLCTGHIAGFMMTTMGTVPLPGQMHPTSAPQREQVPQAFQDAFDKPLHP